MTRGVIANQTLADRPRPLVLASRSPRRAQLLRKAGVDFRVVDPPYADPADPNQERPASSGEADGRSLAGQLARRKVLSVDASAWPAEAVLLSADTLCIDAEGRLLGTPRSADEALAILTSLRDATHQIVTGVALLCRDPSIQTVFETIIDTAEVHLGPLSDGQLRDYVATGDWAGKAGGYNLAERLDAGWPLRVRGDPATVMGLPMRRLLPRLADLGVTPAGESAVR